jgi:hypothetical protein
VFIGSGKLGFPDAAIMAFALGCDMVNVGREALLSIGCIQALRCHTNHCPTGITTQNAWLSRGLDPTLKSVRLANYIVSLRKDILALCRACGVPHPSLVPANRIEVLDDRFGAKTVADVFGGRGRGIESSDDDGDHIEKPLGDGFAPLIFRKSPVGSSRWPGTPRS